MISLLDTNACIALLKGDKTLTSLLRKKSPQELRLCSIVRAELLYGAYKSSKRSENLRTVRRLCQEFESLPFDDGAADHYGHVRASLAAAGTPIGPNDLLIASIALANGIGLLTRNVDEFERVPGLVVETW